MEEDSRDLVTIELIANRIYNSLIDNSEIDEYGEAYDIIFHTLHEELILKITLDE